MPLWYFVGFWYDISRGTYFHFPIAYSYKAKYFVIGYAAIELVSAIATTGDGVAHIAHLGGMVVGFFMIRYWKNKLMDIVAAVLVMLLRNFVIL